MRIIDEIHLALTIIGACKVAHWIYLAVKAALKAKASARKSQEKFRAQTEVLPVEGQPEIGVETPWPDQISR